MADLIIALDVATRAEAVAMVDRLGDDVERYKVGSQLFTGAGPDVVRELRDRGKRVFLDLKFHDIPNTVRGAVAAAAELDVEMLTVHASGGSAMMSAAREAAGDLVASGRSAPRLIGVTLLTSFTASDVQEVWAKELRSIRDEVARLAGLASDAGLDGVVASTAETEVIKRRHGSDFLVITPGIRPSGEVAGDQARTATPADAVRAGADFLVVGRPVTKATDPAGAVRQIREELAAPQDAAS